MRSICFYFQVHQPVRLKTFRFFEIGQNHPYFDDYQNRFIMQRVAQKCYLPANQVMLDLIAQYGSRFRIAYSISGTAIDQFEQYAPEVLESFQQLAKTGCVEFLAETYCHSLAALKSKDEFIHQIELHRQRIKELFDYDTVTFRNTELIYSDMIGEIVADMGFNGMLTEGAKHVLGWKSPNYLYCNVINPKLRLLLKNFRLSDDIAFRFSQRSWSDWPLTTEKFVGWLNNVDAKEPVVNLFMDYETFGEHQWPETGIFDFLRALPGRVFSHSDYSFNTPKEIYERLQPVSAIHVPYPISWADEERDLTAWLGNPLQNDAFDRLYDITDQVLNSGNDELIKIWRYLQTSDHFYYMCTKWFSDGDVHKYFNPYGSPYDAYINYMNILSDFIIRLENDNNTTIPVLQKKESAVYHDHIIESVKNPPVRFKIISDFKTLKRSELKILFETIDAEDLAIALKGTRQELREYMIIAMSAKQKKIYHLTVKNLREVNKDDVQVKRDQLLNKVNLLFS